MSNDRESAYKAHQEGKITKTAHAMPEDGNKNAGKVYRSENQEIERLLKSKPFYIKVWAVLELNMISGITDSAELKENILGNIGTVAVIGALFGGANLASFMSVTGVEVGDPTIVGQLIGAIRFSAAGAGLISSVYAAIIMTMMNAIPKDRFRPWALDNVYLFPLPTICLLASLGMFSFDMPITSYFLYGVGTTGYIIGCFFIAGCIILTLGLLAMCVNEPEKYKNKRLSVYEDPRESIMTSNPMMRNGQIRVRTENQEIERLLKDQPLYIKVWAVLELNMISGITDSAELKENILGNLSTVAVIGALFGGANLSSFMTATGIEVGDPTIVGQLIGCIRFTAAGCGLVASVYAAIIMTMMNAIPKDRFRPWALDNVYLFPLPTICLLGCMNMFGLDVIITSYFLYGVGTLGYIIGAFFICICIILTLAFVAMCVNDPTKYQDKSPDVQEKQDGGDKKGPVTHGQLNGNLPPTSDTAGNADTNPPESTGGFTDV